MAQGFYKASLVGEYFGQDIVNVLHYRVVDIVPQAPGWGGADSLAAEIVTHVATPLRNCLPVDYTLLRVEVIAYNSSYDIITPSPWVTTVNQAGTRPSPSVGAALAMNISLLCGQQVQISGVAQSRRNRGYLCVGPLIEVDVDQFSHLTALFLAGEVTPLAQKLDDSLISALTLTTFVPIRIHRRWVLGIEGVTYSDVIGYRLPRVATFRRSRVPEA